jgi:peptidoglycan/LPS O-acetylase OafA/YrhL
VIWSAVFFIVVYYHWSQGYTLVGYLKHLVTGYPFHFIPLLVFFYILSPLMVIPAKKYPVLLLGVILIYQFILIVILNPNIFGFQFPGWMNRLAIPALKTTMSEWALYFPIGLVYGLHARKIQPVLKKYAWLSASIIVMLFILAILSGFKIISMPAARYLLMLSFVLLIPAIRRDQIPFLSFFERIGKMTYGLYLTHLICIDLFVIVIQLIYPKFLGWSGVLILSMFIVGVSAPIAIMEFFSRGRQRKIYRYLFG